MKRSFILLTAAIGLASLSAQASLLKNSDVTGTITLTGSPGYSANTFGMTTSIGNGVEFSATTNTISGMTTGARPKPYSFTDLYTANFTDILLTVNSTCTAITMGGCNNDVHNPFTLVFTDSAFVGLSIVEDTAKDGYSFVHSGDTVTVTFAGGANPAVYKLDFAIASAPEPGSLALLGTGLTGIFGIARRRFRA